MENVLIRATPGRWLQRAWDRIKPNLETFIVLALIYMAAMMAAAKLASVVGEIVVAGGLAPGFFLACLRGASGAKPTVNDLFDGFKYWMAGILAVGLIQLLTCIGLVFFVIPGILILALYLFTPLFIIDKKMEFWPAMEASRKLVLNDLFGFFLMALLLVGLNLLGILALGVGLLITVPLGFMMITVAYMELVGAENYPPPTSNPINIP